MIEGLRLNAGKETGSLTATNEQDTTHSPFEVKKIIRSLSFIALALFSVDASADEKNKKQKCAAKADAGAIRELTCTVSEITLNGSVKGEYSSVEWYALNGGNILSDRNSLKPLIDAPGTYVMRVLSKDGCITESQTNVELNLVTPRISGEVLNANCGPQTGNIKLDISGGEPPYNVNWMNGIQTTELKNVSEGIYKVRVEDSKGCATSAEFEVSEGMPLITSINKDDAACGNKGSANLTVAGGTGNYSFYWSNGERTQDVKDLEPGDHSVTVVDGNGCLQDVLFRIETKRQACTEGPLNVTAKTAVTKGIFEAFVDVEVKGGVPPYTYQWSHGPLREDVMVPAGIYSILVTDVKGSQYEQIVRVGAKTEDETDGFKERLSLFPNPASEKTTLEFNVIPFSDVCIEMYSTKGDKAVQLYKGSIESEHERTIEIDLSKYSKGSYVVLMHTDKRTIMSKLVISK